METDRRICFSRLAESGTLKIGAVIVMLIFASVGAHADLVVSSAPTSNVNCAGTICTATAANAVLNAGTLQTMLGTSSVTLATGSAAMDTDVETTITWPGAETLTVDSQRSIRIDAPIAITGLGGLTLVTDDGGTGGDLSFVQLGRIAFDYRRGKLKINGATYELVNNIARLAAAIASRPSGNYALMHGYDAKKDGTYAASPINVPFLGVFEGLGNTIAHLTIVSTSSSEVGLFERIGVPGEPQTCRCGAIRDIALSNVSISASAVLVGGLVGGAYYGGVITQSSVAGTITASGEAVEVGGLAGLNGGVISRSHSSAKVSAGDFAEVGGLFGFSTGPAPVTESYATGNVTGGFNAQVGGLAGQSGLVSKSYATGRVTGGADSQIGGLVGVAGMISQSFATGTVRGGGGSNLGGLAGEAHGVEDSYATGPVRGGTTGSSVLGGLVGSADQPITTSYSSGALTDGSPGVIGGFVGEDHTKRLFSHDYWDRSTSRVPRATAGAGNKPHDPGITGLTTTQLQSGVPAGFDPTIWAENAGVNNGLPYLLANPPPSP